MKYALLILSALALSFYSMKPVVKVYPDPAMHLNEFDTASFTIEAARHNMYVVDGKAGTVAYKEKGSTWIIKDSAAALKVLLDCLEMEQKNLILRRYERGQMAKY